MKDALFCIGYIILLATIFELLTPTEDKFANWVVVKKGSTYSYTNEQGEVSSLRFKTYVEAEEDKVVTKKVVDNINELTKVLSQSYERNK